MPTCGLAYRGVRILTPFELPASFARVWMDGSVQMMRATSEFWGQILGAQPAARPRSLTSTASPWWMAPQSAPTPTLPGLPFMWPAELMQTPWSSLTAATTPQPQNPVELWQQMWLQAAPLAALGGAMAPGLWKAAEPAPPVDPWPPVATVYRTASGHAMAAVLRTMAAAVEPQPRTPMLTDFWPYSLATTRH